MAMSKKVYESVARIIRETKPNATRETNGSLVEIAERLASLFANDNPRFDRTRFLEACGIQ